MRRKKKEKERERWIMKEKKNEVGGEEDIKGERG